jgi:hypothetical protein
MSEDLIRQQLKSIVQSASGIGVVYDYERFSRSLGDFIATMSANGIVNGWFIHRQSSQATNATMGATRQIERVHTYRITGIFEMDDASGSEKTFQDILEAIFNTLKGNGTLNGSCLKHDHFQIESVTVTKANQIGKDLYHIAEGKLVVTERTSI